MAKKLTLLLIFFVIFRVSAQIPSGYYDPAAGKTGATLKTALFGIIKTHNERSYTQLWTDFQTTDKKADGKVWDMYSNISFTFGSNQCGNYSKEGDCYNREHSMPKSWFNDATPMYSDLFHLVPTDGYVNGKRSNYPFGEVASPTYTSGNGSKLGPCSFAGYTGVVFEPVDEYKGDFARNYFYMATCYEDKIAGWVSDMLAGNAYPAFKTWSVNLLLKWNSQDPVSQKEIARNNAVYGIQGNRNPYIDHPEYAASVWSPGGGTVYPSFTSTAITSATESSSYSYNITVTGKVGATFTITAPTKPSWLTLTDNGNGTATLSGTPATGSAGNYNVTLTVSDQTNTTNQTFTIVVSASGTNVNPSFTSTAITSATESSLYTYNISVTGKSGATFTITAPTKPSWLTLTDNGNGTATLSGTPASGSSGNYNVTLTVSDQTNTASQNFTVVVSASGGGTTAGTETCTNMTAGSSSYTLVNWIGDNSIAWTASAARTDQTLNGKAICLQNSGTPYLLSGTISGGCGSISFKHQQMFSGTGGTIQLQVNGTNVGSPVTVTATAATATFNNINIVGTFTIKLISSGATRIALDDISWTGFTNIQPPVNPSFTSTPITTAVENNTYSYTISVTGKIGGTFGITATTKPSWLTLTDNGNGTALLSGIPPVGSAGNINISLKVSDQTNTANQDFTLVVSGNGGSINPSFTSSAITSSTVGNLYSYNITVSGKTGAVFTITAPTKPAWLNLTDNGNGTAVLSGTPAAGNTGSYNISLSVSDQTNTAKQDFILVVSGGGTTVYPSFSSTAILYAKETNVYTYNITVTGKVGATFTITAPTKPSWLTLTDNGNGTALLTGTPPVGSAGNQYISLSVSDQTNTSKQEFMIGVVSNNLPATLEFTSTALLTGNLCTEYSYSIATKTSGTYPRTITCSVKPTWLTFKDNGNGTALLSGTATATQVGTHNVELTLSDNVSALVKQTFVITVAANKAPVITSLPSNLASPSVEYSYSITAKDDDACNTLVISASLKPSWLNFTVGTNNTAILSGKPTLSDVGVHLVEISVSDNIVQTPTKQAFTVTVVGSAPNALVDITNSDNFIQVRPNPFSGSCTLTVNAPSSEIVRIDLITISGVKIATIGQYKLVKGINQLFLNSFESISSGVYVMKITGKSFTQQIQVLISK